MITPEHFPLVYLASRSPRRVELLKQIGIHCEILPADIDETPHMNELPTDYVMRLARQKAEAALQNVLVKAKPLPVIAADTTVELDGIVLSKPENDTEAKQMLQTLSGRTHQVHTAVSLAWRGKIEVILSSTYVEMMALNTVQIDAYIQSGEPQDKAGSYGIQGLAGAWIKHIEGSYTGVMGLPVYETASLLRAHGLTVI
ncbi:MAG: septum formation inhibitor Maf [Methylotenera sp.]|nr:MAG: septum formation inhibitor Maf [Methylotenera sp.]